MASIEGLKAATDITKQIITLSTGAVAFTITFLDKFRSAPEGAAIPIPMALYVAWVLFGLAILFALLNLMGITATLEAIDRRENGWQITKNQEAVADGSKKHERWAAQGMIWLFLAAVVAMIAAGFSTGR
jgi:hypothetical protein